MKQEQTEIITKEQAKADIRVQVQEQMATLSTRIPSYEELSEEGKKRVDEYIAKINISDPSSIDKFGKEETEEIYDELNMLIGTMQTHDVSIGDMFAELMTSIGEEEQEETSIRDMIRSPFKAVRTLKNKAKKTAEKEKYRRAKVMANMDVIKEKLEGIRIELKVNAGKLETMAQNSAEQYNNTQYQIIALQETLRRLRDGELGDAEQETAIAERTFAQIDRNLRVSGVEKRIERKIANCRGICVNAATKAIMSRLLSIHNEDLASNYDQDISSLLPELKSLVLMSQANDSLLTAADTHDKFVGTMNQILRQESERSKQALQKVQNISTGSVIETETAKALTSDVIEAVKGLRQIQQKGHVGNEAFTEIMADFRKQLSAELEIGEEAKPIIKEGTDR